mmetsp:Transcript_18028/g.30555  ORF Transcript_18028/g.30555 Transcript_18028/m.30555 type:complete len:223 (-) Transcript_18028:76-744(-)
MNQRHYTIQVSHHLHLLLGQIILPRSIPSNQTSLLRHQLLSMIQHAMRILLTDWTSCQTTLTNTSLHTRFTIVMPACGNYGILEWSSAYMTCIGYSISSILGIILFVSTKVVIITTLLLLHSTTTTNLPTHHRIHKPLHLPPLPFLLPPLPLLIFLLHLPPTLGIPPIMQINTSVAKAAESSLFVIFANVGLVVEAGGGAYEGCGFKGSRVKGVVGCFLEGW